MRQHHTSRRLWRPAMLVLAAMLASGCAVMTAMGIGPTKLDATVETAKNVNPDDTGRASPIVVRLYELKSVDTFANTDFFSLYDKEASTLGQDLVGREELELQPGGTHVIRRKVGDGTQYIGVMAAYRDIDRAHWRATYKLRPHATNRLTIRLGRDSVAINTR